MCVLISDIVDKDNTAYHSTMKTKPVDLNSSTYVDSGQENDEKDSKLNIGVHARISKYKNNFQIGRVKCLGLKKLKILCIRHMLLVILMVKKLIEEIAGALFEKKW